MKKRFLQLLLVAGMVLTLAGCKKEGSNEEETTTQIEFSNDSSDELDKALLAALIGENTSADKIIYDLDMPTIVDKNGVRWTRVGLITSKSVCTASRTRSAVLPISAFSKLLREIAPITNKSTPRSSTKLGMTSSGKPSSKCRLAFSTG